MLDKWRSETKDSEIATNPQNKQKRNKNEKERKSYARTRKKKNSVWRGFVIITIMLKRKRKTAKTCNPVRITCFKKKVKEGPDYICSVCCLVNYHINWEKLFFACVSQSTCCLLLLAQMNGSSTWTMQRKFITVLIISSLTWYTILPRISRFLPQSRVHWKARGLTILPISYSDFPQSESNLKKLSP